MKAPFKIEWLLVTPCLAAKWLAKNTHNRNLRETTVANYVRDMLNGAWSPNHQGIAIGEDGALMDGQHRLSAIARSGVSVPMLVCTDVPRQIEGVESRVMDTVDRGNARSIPDILKLEHGLKADAGMIAAACLMIARICVPVERFAKRATLHQTLELLQRFQPGLKFVSENRPSVFGLRGAVICGAVAFAHGVKPQATEDFYRRFGSGAGLKQGDAILTLRNHVSAGKAASQGGSSSARREAGELVLHALWCHVHHKAMPAIPRPEARVGAEWFRQQQADRVAAVRALFPADKTGAPKLTRAAEKLLERTAAPAAGAVVKAGDVKLTPLAESLLRGKEMSERLQSKLGRKAVAA